MTSSIRIASQPSSNPAGGERPDQLYWLSKVDEDIPKAVIVPDHRRSTAVDRAYDSVGFEISADAVRMLKSVHPSHGISDAALCAGLVAVLLGKYQREDCVVLGLMSASVAVDTRVLVPLCLSCAGDDTFAGITSELAKQLADMSTRSPAMVTRLPQIMGLELGTHRHPLFDIAMAVSDAGTAIDVAAYPVDLAFLFETGGGRIRGRVLYAKDLYGRGTVERMCFRLGSLASQLAAGTGDAKTGLTVRDVDPLTPDERRQVLQGFNARTSHYPLHETFHSLFEAQARQTPDATAVSHGDRRLSYAALNERANQLAYTLLSQGLKKGDFVGILLQRSCEFVVAMLGVFKAGGAYVPLDPTYPRDRIGYMLEDSEAAFLVTDAKVGAGYASIIGECRLLRAVLSQDGTLEGRDWPGRAGMTLLQPGQLASAPSHNPELGLTGADRAYMIYTSGSTGRPKGAICRHDGALNHLFGELEGIGVKTAFNFLQTAASSSDISVWQFMAPLLYGGATVIADYETVVDPVLLALMMRQHAVTVAEPVPVVLRALIDHLGQQAAPERALPDLRCMMCTGEALPSELVDRWLTLYPEIPIANTYGPTETSDDVTLLVLREPVAHRFAVAPIGQPLPNVPILVLDRDLRPVPVGVPGEICIAGVAVGEGYWRQPEKTAAAFVPCPYPEVSGGRMYRTGDLGRWLADGSIEFLGRLDQQVKLRGFRVEPGEIEQVLTQHPSVQDAAVVVVDDGAGNRRLVGHYVVLPNLTVTAAELRQFLKGKLADHMVPAALVPVRALPLTPLGKVDRRALTRVQATGSGDAESYVAPRSALESTLAEIWARVVGVDRVGVLDNFFEIGGDSILTIHVVAALRQRGFRVAPKDVFRHPTVSELAANLGNGGTVVAMDGAPARQASVEQSWDLVRWREVLAPLFPDLEDVYPLSATQRGIYFQSLLVPKASGAYVEQIVFGLVGDLDAAAFQTAWQHVVQAFESLRTAVVRRGAPFPLQVVVRSAHLVPSFLDLSELAPERQKLRLASLVADDRMKGFDLKKPPLCRVTLVRLGAGRWQVLWSYHHLILDGWAEPLVLEAVFKSYDAVLQGREPAIETGTRYRDFVLWSEAQDPQPAESFWRAQLAGFVAPVTITDSSPAVAPPSSSEVSHGWEHARLDAEEMHALDHVARRHGLTLSTVLHGAWALLLHRRTGSDDVMFGSIASGRQCAMAGIESVHGLVAVTQPLRTRVPPDAAITTWLRLLQLQMAEMREHEHTPLAMIQQWSDVPTDKRPMFDTIVVVGNYAGSDLAGCRPASLAVGEVSYFTQPLFAFTLFATVEPTLALSLVYDKRRCAPETATELLAEFRRLLADIGENPEQRVAGLLESSFGPLATRDAR